MIHFVIATGPAGACTDLGDRLASALRSTALLGGEIVEAVSPSGTWRFAAIEVPDPFARTRWHADGECLAVSNGCGLERDGRLSLAATSARYRAGGADAARDAVVGTYNLVAIAPERGLAMFGDVAGCFPLYHAGRSDLVVISNRSTTVAHVLGLAGWDLHTLAWLASMSLLAGDAVPADGVQVMPPGRIARIPWRSASLAVEPGPHPVLVAASGEQGRADLSSAEWDRVTDDLLAEVRAIRHVEGQVALPITGGKDSRLLLALVRAAGLSDVVTYTSTGPEVASAAAVAAAAGYPHVVDLPIEVARPPASTVVVGPGAGPGLEGRPWRRAARAAGRYEGIVAMWAGFKTPVAPATLVLKGWGGEIYRFRGRVVPCADRLYDGHRPGGGGVAAMSTFYANRVDPLRVLVPDERARQVAWFDHRIRTTADELRLDLVPDDLWLSHKSNQYQGAVLQGTPLRPIANPLVSRAALGRYAELSLGARRTDRLHFEVMRRAAPDLVALPFFEQTWSPEIRATAGEALPSEPLASRLGRRAARLAAASEAGIRSWVPGHQAWAAVRRTERSARTGILARTPISTPSASGSEAVWQLMDVDPAPVVDLLRDAADVGLASICDVDRLCELVEHPPRFTRREEIQLMDAFGIALLLLGRTERVVDTV